MLRALSLTALILVAAPAMAQNPQPTSPTNPTVPVAPPNAASPPPEQIAPPDGTLSNRLSQQKGTITPPNVDPGMTVSPPRKWCHDTGHPAAGVARRQPVSRAEVGFSTPRTPFRPRHRSVPDRSAG